MEDTEKRSEFRGKQVIRISAGHGWGALGLREVWEFRDLLWFYIYRNVKGKYRQMALGPLWIILQPIINMVLFSLIFGKLAGMSSEGVPYYIFTFSALVPWTFFQTATYASSQSLVEQMGVISKVYFPRLIMPVSAVLGAMVDFVIAFVVLLVLMLAAGIWPGWNFLYFPLFVLLGIIVSLSVGFWSATMAVRFRDLQFLVMHGLRAWMFLSPVAYSATEIPQKWLWLYQLNPMYWVIEGFRWSTLGVGSGPTDAMWGPILLSLVLFVTGAYVFRRTERTIVDLL